MTRSIADYALRAAIARDGAPLARPVRKPDPPARPAYVPPPPAIHVRECDDCGRDMSQLGEDFSCVCGRADTLYSVTHEGAAGWVRTYAVSRQQGGK